MDFKNRLVEKTIAALSLKLEVFTSEIDCDTGTIFYYCKMKLTLKGKLLGLVKATKSLEETQKKCVGWHNVALIKWEAFHYKFLGNIAGILATFSIKASPNYEQFIVNIARSSPKTSLCDIR